jgi:hypothetical protein
MSVLINASTTTGLVQTADTSGTIELQSNGTTQLTVSSTGAYGQLKFGTAVATTSGASVLITGVPTWARRVTLTLNGVTSSGSSYLAVQLGSGGSLQTTGYTGTTGGVYASSASSTASGSTSFLFSNTSTGVATYGTLVFVNVGSNTWILSGTVGATNRISSSAGGVTLTAALDRLSIADNAPGTFSAGSINILYEG